MKAKKLKDLKCDEMFTLKDISQPVGRQVWIKGEYDRSEKKYLCINFADANKYKYLKTNTLVFFDFWF